MHDNFNDDRNAQRSTSRDDEGFSFAQVIVTMVIVGILGAAIGFTAFQFIGQSRETVLAANVRTAADAIQNTLALKPHLRETPGVAIPASGALPIALMSELSNTAGFEWTTGDWEFDSDDTVEKVRVQMIKRDEDAGDAAGADTGAAPIVWWLVADGDAVRLHIRNEDGAWACALVVLRPDWILGDNVEVEGKLRGIWFDSGTNITGSGGVHDCSPATVADEDLAVGDDRHGITDGTTGNDPPPIDGARWAIPHDDGPG